MDILSAKNFDNRLELRESLLFHQLHEFLDTLGKLSSTKKLHNLALYQKLKKDIESVLNGIEYGFYALPSPDKKPFYRAVAWNVERGIYLDGIIQTLKEHPQISNADLYLVTETDAGMARSRNKNVAREMALALGMNYFFAPSYLNLCKGNSVEAHYDGVNELGLHGNAILSRYPLEDLRIISLPNCKDKMKGKEKRLGCQKALIATVCLPSKKMTAVCAHLDAHSSHRQRAHQMKLILEAVKDDPNPVLLGGDLNTCTYNANHALFAFFGFWHKVFMGVDDVIDNHYPYPDRYFDRFLFKELKRYGMDYESLNEIGKGTLHYHVDDLKGNHLVKEVIPEWCRQIMEKTLRRHGGKVSLKLDWFAGKGIKAASQLPGASPPQVVSKLIKDGKPLSDHDAILLDFNF